MELEELNAPQGMPLLCTPFLITENRNPGILDPAAPDHQTEEQSLTHPLPKSVPYTIKNPDSAFKDLIESLLK